jgi:predicted HTH transcriptional regulator
MHEPLRDARILEDFGLDDLDGTSVDEFRTSFAATKPKHPWLALDQKALLEQLGCWRKNRDSGSYGLTLAGLLMFGKHEAIIAPNAAPNYFVDYRDYREQKTPGDPWSDRLFPDGTWEANLFQFLQRGWARLTADLHVPHPLKAEQRIEKTVVHLALREAVHQRVAHPVILP